MKQLSGLSSAEVLKRQADEIEEKKVPQITKSNVQIIKDNVFTLFNLLNFLIAILLLTVGAYTNLLFIGIILFNIFIGIAQEFKAKKLVDELSILNRPTVCVRRDDHEQQVALEEVVKDDLMVLESGNQICNDAIVIDGALEVNESLLTGESDAILKEEGSTLYSGSFVVSGKAYAKVLHVGTENYATKLIQEVKKERQVQSELLGSMKKVTNFTSFLIIPLGILLFLEATLLRQEPFAQSVVSASAALLGMLPKGLVLLISVSLATGVIRLAKMKILVQNIYSLETLAHVDVLCLDKTGTLTDGNLTVHSVSPMSKLANADIDPLIQSYFAACDDNNATFHALETVFPKKLSYQPVKKVPFSSKRKWGAISFKEMGTIIVGAPERLLPAIPPNIDYELSNGRRAILIGYSSSMLTENQQLPEQIRPLYSVILEDTIRKHAKETLQFFKKEGVDVKIISGDHVKTVSMIAKKAGLTTWKKAIDLSAIEEPIDFDALCQSYSVFARVTPKQKQELVMALKRQGHQVAMTGDGVNDLLALKEADCSIAVADGSDASKQMAQIVLLDSNFTNLPQVVMEGRKVIHNVTRTAGVFFIKTIYSMLVSLLCLLLNVPFPFIPIQITLIDACIEAYPSFLTIVESDTRRIKGHFLNKAFHHALPFGVIVTALIAFVQIQTPFSAAQNQTIMYVLLILISMTAVIKSCIPFNRLRIFLCVTMFFGTFFALSILPNLFSVSALTAPMILYICLAFAIAILFLLGYFVMKKQRTVARKQWKKF